VSADREGLFNRFKFHPADTREKQKSHEAVRAQCLELAISMDILIPDGREKALVMTKIEEVMFWANAAIARSRISSDDSG
jgi:hypothetical protein